MTSTTTSLGGTHERIEDIGENHNIDVRNRLTWVPDHTEGHLWIYQKDPPENDDGAGPYWPPYHAWQVNVIRQEGGEWDWVVVTHFEVGSDAWSNGIGHDGENLWIGTRDSDIVRIVDDGIVEPRWLIFDPPMGVVPANDEAAIGSGYHSGELPGGIYEFLFRYPLAMRLSPNSK